MFATSIAENIRSVVLCQCVSLTTLERARVSHTTNAAVTARQMLQTMKSLQRHGWRMLMTLSLECLTAMTQWWARGAHCCRVGRSNALLLPAPLSRTQRYKPKV